MAGKGLYRPALTLILGTPHLSSLLSPRVQTRTPSTPGPGLRGHPPAHCPSDQQGVRSVRPFSSPAPSASLPSASLSWARGHELQEQDMEEKVFCCVNTALGLRWMNSAKEPAPWSAPFRAGHRVSANQASFQRRRLTPTGKRTKAVFLMQQPHTTRLGLQCWELG